MSNSVPYFNDNFVSCTLRTTDLTTNDPDRFEITSMVMMPMLTTAASVVAEETMVKPSSQYDYATATFEIILPVIFGIFISLTMR